MYTTPARRNLIRLGQLRFAHIEASMPDVATPGRPGIDDLPSEVVVWKLMAARSALPSVVIRRPESLRAVFDEWLALSKEYGVVADDDTFLLSVPSEGPALGWFRAKLTSLSCLPSADIDEFVTLSPDGLRYSAVSSEEDDYWVILGET